MELSKNLPILLFITPEDWHDWLKENHNQHQGLWLKHAKKSSGKQSISYEEALEYALCYGWIDSQKQAYDKDYYLQKFTPRGLKSIWSKVNVSKVETLIKMGKMQPAGLAAVNAAKQDGRWATAYEPASTVSVPEDFQAELNNNPEAKDFFETLDKANVYSFLWRINTAKKPETRKARIEKFIVMLNKGEKLH